ncbi:MAG TPA: hypothetical protein VKY74_02235 [Chloroflexia bacterium]|nr:hypothetical protein [Chloroflexia bacterium]
MKVSVPVSPYIATFAGVEDVVLSLLGLAPTASLSLPARPPAGVKYSHVTLELQQTDVQGMLDIGISGAVTFAAQAKAQTFFFLSDLSAWVTIPNTDPTSVIVDATFSVGVRIGIFAFNLDTSMKLDAETVAAQATVKQAITAYQAVVLGAGLEAIDAMKPLITNSTGPFRVETLQTIGAVRAGLEALLADPATSLTPVLTSVTVDTAKVAQAVTNNIVAGLDLTTLLKSHTFAMERAFRSVPAQTAVEEVNAGKGPGVTAPLVAQAYQDLLGLSGMQPVPPDKQQIAANVLSAGRNL